MVFTSGYQDSRVTPQPKLRKTILFGRASAGAAEAKRRHPSDSSIGRAIKAELLRRKPRREGRGDFMGGERCEPLPGEQSFTIRVGSLGNFEG